MVAATATSAAKPGERYPCSGCEDRPVQRDTVVAGADAAIEATADPCQGECAAGVGEEHRIGVDCDPNFAASHTQTASTHLHLFGHRTSEESCAAANIEAIV